MPDAPTRERKSRSRAPDPDFDWRRIAYLVQVSRELHVDVDELRHDDPPPQDVQWQLVRLEELHDR